MVGAVLIHDDADLLLSGGVQVQCSRGAQNLLLDQLGAGHDLVGVEFAGIC